MASRNSICLKTKKEIIRDCTELNKKKSDVAIEHNLSINTIYSILKQKNRILQSARKTSTIKLRDGAFKELDERLYQYTCECKSNSQHVSSKLDNKYSIPSVLSNCLLISGSMEFPIVFCLDF